jgi:CheY-like chemotaxis protein
MPLSKVPPKHAEQSYRLASAAVTRTTAPGSETRILIVDQDRQVGVSLSFMLSARRYEEVRVVRSAKRAVAITEQFRPEIVFLDLELPDDGGISVARHLARNAHNIRPRLVALTKDADVARRQEARAAGFERFLTKPVLHEELDKILAMGRTKT